MHVEDSVQYFFDQPVFVTYDEIHLFSGWLLLGWITLLPGRPKVQRQGAEVPERIEWHARASPLTWFDISGRTVFRYAARMFW